MSWYSAGVQSCVPLRALLHDTDTFIERRCVIRFVILRIVFPGREVLMMAQIKHKNTSSTSTSIFGPGRV